MAVPFGRRLRKGATTTAVAAVAIAALSASQAPGAVLTGPGGANSAEATPPPGTPATGNSPYYTDLPPLNPPDKPLASIDLPAEGPAEAGIPASVLAAYKQAEQSLAESKPDCRLPWQLLAAIGKVESGQARGGNVDANGTTITKILGPVLNGAGFANIPDTDNGQYDGDSTHDRAVGPMQFIPSTWATSGQDGNGDGRKDPNNIYDAALAAGYYLCAAGRDLSVDADLHKAILSYNHSQDYLDTVLSWLDYYRKGTHEVPDGTGVLPSTPGPTGTVPSTPTPSTPVPSTPVQDTSPSPTPPTSKPSTPSTPTAPGSDSPSTPSTPPPTNGGGTDTPSPKPPVVTRLEKAATGTFTAVAGSSFPGRVAVRAEDSAGKPVAKVAVQFEIVGTTDARFAADAVKVTVTTGSDGLAVAPALKAGEKTGTFTVRATVSVPLVTGVSYTATVTARQADALTRADTNDLTAVEGTEFAGPVQAKATYQGAVAAGVAATATVINSAEDPTIPADGPYFKGADGSPLRTLEGLTTGADGVIQLPTIFAGEASGTFLLRIRTEGGGELTIPLKVTAAPTTPTEPSTPDTPSETSSTSPSATPSG